MDNTLNEFDVVRLKHTKNVTYLSGPPGRATSPKGDWSIVGFVDGQCILAKQSTLIRVPPQDIVRIASYDLNSVSKNIAAAASKRIDIVASISDKLGISKDKATALCRKYNVPLKVDSRVYEQKAIKKVTEAIQKENEGDGQRKG